MHQAAASRWTVKAGHDMYQAASRWTVKAGHDMYQAAASRWTVKAGHDMYQAASSVVGGSIFMTRAIGRSWPFRENCLRRVMPCLYCPFAIIDCYR
jgi:hypothetical protein